MAYFSWVSLSAGIAAILIPVSEDYILAGDFAPAASFGI